MNSPIVVNLYGGPGCGKSTGAAYIFSRLKTAGVNAELIAEYAKDKTWENNQKAIKCQEYIFGNQSFKLARCRDDVEVIITDSPLLLSIIYNNNPALDVNFEWTVRKVYDTYHNMNYFLRRVKPYNPKGRNQTEEESREIDVTIRKLLACCDEPFDIVNGNVEGYDIIVEKIMKLLKETKESQTVANTIVEQVEKHKLNTLETLNYYRNYYRSENKTTEQGVMVDALNDLFLKYELIPR